MSLRYKGARLSATPPTTTGGTTAGANAAPGIWTLDQQMKAQGQSAWPSVGNFIEDVFSTWVYAGNSATQTVTNNINLSGQGGLVWVKNRTSNSTPHRIWDTVQGGTLSSNSTAAKDTYYGAFFSASSTGFNLNSTGAITDLNQSGENYVSWTFRKQAKFFDLVTYTGDGTAGRTVSHNLGATPGCIIIKRTDAIADWYVYHRSLSLNGSAPNYVWLNDTSSQVTGSSTIFPAAPTSTVFSVGNASAVNSNGATFVAYLFAHDAGGFGAAGTDNVISCGSLTTNASGISSVNLGYEPQWILLKGASGTNATSQWVMFDTMRGWTNPANNARLFANLSNAETSGDGQAFVTSTGFGSPNGGLGASTTYIYIAIRRGPMKTPTSGTSVFSPVARTGTGANATVSSGFITDLVIPRSRASSTRGSLWFDRMRGKFLLISSANTDAELSDSQTVTGFDTQNGVLLGTDNSPIGTNQSGVSYINYFFRRAPGFFDVVCYTGTGVTNRTVTHNLTVAPELLFVKARNNIQNWSVLCTLSGGLQGRLNTTAALSAPSAAVWGNGTSYVAPTSTVFTVGTDNETNANTWTYVAYLFATVTGVSKVGSYTGTGALQTVNCGFTSGARFVLIKRTDTTGDWWVYDSARGITSGNDPYLFLNSTAAEVTGTNYVDTDSTGFKVTAAAPAGLNANGGTYIFLAIA